MGRVLRPLANALDDPRLDYQDRRVSHGAFRSSEADARHELHPLTAHCEREMTQAELAERIGVTRQTIIAIEQGRYSASLEMAFRIAQVFWRSARRRIAVQKSSGGTT